MDLRQSTERKNLAQKTKNVNQDAVFWVHLCEEFTKKDADYLSHWVRRQDGEYPISFYGVYTTSSTLIILRAPYGLIAELGLREEDFIGIVGGANQMNVPGHPLMPAKWSETHEDEDEDGIMVPHTYVLCTRQSSHIREVEMMRHLSSVLQIL